MPAGQLERFHDELFEAYEAEIGGNAVFRMKEWWFYARFAFAVPLEVHRVVRKARRVDEYQRAAERVFRTQPLADLARFQP